MKIDVLFQNVFNLFIIALIIEIAILAIFSMDSLKSLSNSQPVQIARDVCIALLAVFLCYKVALLSIFRGTGINLHRYLNTAISALVLIGLTNLLKNFFARVRGG